MKLWNQILTLILATFIVTLIIYIAVRIIESKYKASDKKYLIFLIALIIVLILPLILVVLVLVLGDFNFITFRIL